MSRIADGHAPTTSADDDLLPSGPTFALGNDIVDPAHQGFTIVHNYALYFWRPYLGNTAFALWVLLVSFAFGDDGIAYPSISRLARILSNSDNSRAIITGRRKERESRGYAGALALLRHERLVQTIARGHGPNVRYVFRVLKQLPLLRPEQVARLSPRLQEDHANWLDRYGIAYEDYYDAFAPVDAARGSTSAEGQAAAPPAPRARWGQGRPGTAAPRTPPAAPRASAPRTPAAAPGADRAAPGNGGAAPRPTGDAPDETNNTSSISLYQYWWEEALIVFRKQVGDLMVDAYLGKLQPIGLKDGIFYLRAPKDSLAKEIPNRFAGCLRLMVGISLGEVQEVRVIGPEGKDPCNC